MMVALVVLAEVSLALLIILGLVAWKALQRRARDRAAVNTLVTSINTQRSARTQKLTERLKSGGQISDDDALTKANELIKKQNRFYQDAIDLYFSRNNEVLSSLDSRLEDLMEQYATVVVTQTNSETAPDPATAEALEKLSKDVAAMSGSIDELRNENAELHRQLKAAEQELDQLGREYVSAFNRTKELEAAASGEAAPVDEEALLRNMDVPPPISTSAPAAVPTAGEVIAATNEEKADKGLLEDLNLEELIGKDAGPAIDGGAAQK